MLKTRKPARDAFTFSLGGIKTIASFVAAPAIADDRINKIRDERLSQPRDDSYLRCKRWPRNHRPAAQRECA